MSGRPRTRSFTATGASRTASSAATRNVELTEKELQAQLVEIAVLLGWRRIYHTFDSRRSSSGFPDLVLVRDRVVFAELKSEKGVLADAQKQWLKALLDASAEAYVIRPRHIDLIGKVLGDRRTRGAFATHDAAEAARLLEHDLLVELGLRDCAKDELALPIP